ncbi:MAG TPA: DinB family protein [Ohtaekwangia sp.]|uniref:DinB family protein n=1 Tax=Ohtaekwangia sp. TaxID=2066019 RepID=UPI002F930816
MNTLKLVEYNVWANRKITTHLASLSADLLDKPLGGSFGSIKATLIHLLQADWLWVNRWKGIPLADIPAWPLNTLDDIVNPWAGIQEDMLALAPALDREPNKQIEFITRKGAHHVMSWPDIAMHVTNHGTYHRGQITHMIRTAGEEAVATDYFLFCVQP